MGTFDVLNLLENKSVTDSTSCLSISFILVMVNIVFAFTSCLELEYFLKKLSSQEANFASHLCQYLFLWRPKKSQHVISGEVITSHVPSKQEFLSHKFSVTSQNCPVNPLWQEQEYRV